MASAVGERWLTAVGGRRRTAWRGLAIGMLALGVVAYSASLPSNGLRSSALSLLQSRLPAGSDVTAGRATLTVLRGAGPALSLKDVQVSLPEGRRARFGEVVLGARWSGLFGPMRSLREVTLRDVALRAPHGGQAGEFDARAVLSHLDRQFSKLEGSSLQLFQVTNVAVDAPWWHPNWPKLQQAQWRKGDGATFAFVKRGLYEPSLVLRRGSDGTVHDSDVRPGSTIEVWGRDFSPSLLYSRLGARKKRPQAFVPLDLKAELSFDADHGFSGGLANVRARRGHIAPSLDTLVRLDEGEVDLRLPPSLDRILAVGGRVRTTRSQITFSSDITIGRAGVAFELLLGQGQISSHDNEPLAILSGRGSGRFDTGSRHLVLEGMEIETSTGTVAVSGGALWEKNGPSLYGAASVPAMPMDHLSNLWPSFVAKELKAWVDDNVKGGTVGPGMLSVSLGPETLRHGKGRPLPQDALAGELPFSEICLRPNEEFPYFDDLAGRLNLSPVGLDVAITKGRFGEGAEQVLARPSRFLVPQLGGEGSSGFLDLRLVGELQAMAKLADIEPIGLMKKRGISPDDLTGEAKAMISTIIPFAKKGPGAQATTNFAVHLANARSDVPIQGRMIEDADVTIEGRPESYTVRGRALVDDTPASIDLALGPKLSAGAVTLVLDDVARRKLGLDLDGYASGTMVAAVSDLGDGRQSFEVDLKDAVLQLDAVGWRKGAGVPATATFEMAASGSEIVLQNFAIEGEGFGARGVVRIDRVDGFKSAMLSQARLRPSDDFSVELERRDGELNVVARGSSIDARWLGAKLVEPSPAVAADEPGDTVRIKARFDRVRGQLSTTLESARLDMMISRGRVAGVNARASTAGRPVALTLTSGRTVDTALTSSNGGAILRFLGLYKHARGGQLHLSIRERRQQGRGRLTLTDFRVIGEPALTSLVPPSRNGESREERSRRNDFPFDKLVIPFTKSEDHLTLGDVTLRGSMIGATARGWIDFASASLDVGGAIVPSFGLNKVAGHIPIFGTLFGGRDEGLLGVTYEVSGKLQRPVFRLNPASAVAPGIFRKLFEYR